MDKIIKLGKLKTCLLNNPWYIVYAIMRRVPRLIPDALFVRVMYRSNLGRWPDLENPQRFTEKLQWLKLHDHNPLYMTLVDKLAVKKYIAEKLGSQYVFKVLGEWDRVEDVDFDTLPERFVLKCNHFGGGAVLVCKDKKNFDCDSARRMLARQMRKNIFWGTREWPYKNVVPKIFAEEYMEDEYGELRDYKVYCFNGAPKFMLVASNRFTDHNFNMFYMDGRPLPIESAFGKPNKQLVIRQDILGELTRLSKLLAKGIPHVRMDFYVLRGRVCFGEFTFFDSSGLDNYDSDVFDLEMGSWLDLNRVA